MYSLGLRRCLALLATPAAVGLAAAYQSTATSPPAAISPAPSTIPTVVTTRIIAYTNQSADGNRVVVGKGSLPGVEPIDIPLNGIPAWIVTAPLYPGSAWVAALSNGRVQAFRAAQREVVEIAIRPDWLSIPTARRSSLPLSSATTEASSASMATARFSGPTSLAKNT